MNQKYGIFMYLQFSCQLGCNFMKIQCFPSSHVYLFHKMLIYNFLHPTVVFYDLLWFLFLMFKFASLLVNFEHFSSISCSHCMYSIEQDFVQSYYHLVNLLLC